MEKESKYREESEFFLEYEKQKSEGEAEEESLKKCGKKIWRKRNRK